MHFQFLRGGGGHKSVELPNKVILIKHYNEMVHYIAFYKSFKIIMELPHSIWNGFLSDPGKPGVRSLGLDVRHSLQEVCKT